MAVQFYNTDLPDVVELRNISQTYDGGKSHVIENLNFLVENDGSKGKFYIFLGRSGCGKSTILRMIAGLQKPTCGEVLIYGKPKTDATAVSMVFQNYSLSCFPWLSVLDNVALPLTYKGLKKREKVERSMEMVKKVGLEGHEGKYPKQLSGGQLQRIAIARSLVNNSHIILMDEPLSALDICTRLEMQLLLLQIKEALKPTVIFVSHDVQEAVLLGDEIYIIKPNPTTIEKYIHDDLSDLRDVSTKNHPHFLELSRRVEELLFST